VGTAFDEKRATQIAIRFLELGAGNLPRIVLGKYMYVADREALKRWGYPLTWDQYYSLDYGPISSCVLSLSQGKKWPGFGLYWHKFIGHSVGNKPVNTLQEAPRDTVVSQTVIDLVEEIFAYYKGRDIVEESHHFPEYGRPPKGKRLPITYLDILAGVGCGKPEEIAEELEEDLYARRALSN